MSAPSARDIAAELRLRLPDLGSKKLHKLLYYCQGYHLAAFGSPLFSETVSAWDMGPVVGVLWRRERDEGLSVVGLDLPEGALNTIGYVVSRYGSLNGAELERLTHNEPPWQEADRKRRSGTSAPISLVTMRDYFASASVEESDGAMPILDAEVTSQWLDAVNRQRRDAEAQVDNPDDLLRWLAAVG